MLEHIKRYLSGPAFAEAVKKATRTFAYAFLAVLVPGLLGWLHALTAWAQAQGQEPFPAATSLGYLAVSAIVAGVISLVNLLGIVVEDATGTRPLRRNEGGYIRRPHVAAGGIRTVDLRTLTEGAADLNRGSIVLDSASGDMVHIDKDGHIHRYHPLR
jgi:hypothetical protein